jgi:phosphosulfolactate synthase (CoM biosynthesis protein A)
MEPVKEQWTDERLDDLNHRVSDGFDRIDADLRSIRTEIGALRAETNARFGSLQRTMLQLGGGMIATFVVGFAGLLATHA